MHLSSAHFLMVSGPHVSASGEGILALTIRDPNIAPRCGHEGLCGRMLHGVALVCAQGLNYVDDEEPVWLRSVGSDLRAEEVHGEWIGLAKFSAQGTKMLRSTMEAMGEDGSLARASLVDVFGRLMAAGQQIGVVYVLGGWFDVDGTFDLAEARNLLWLAPVSRKP